eukprot:m.161670 g.161670  ORF g.161670 m.161670 type:complete len:176 (+) comp18052_c0_seq3:1930-2457(+)
MSNACMCIWMHGNDKCFGNRCAVSVHIRMCPWHACAAAQYSPLLDYVLWTCEKTLAKDTSMNVEERTGPKMYTKAIHAFLSTYASPSGMSPDGKHPNSVLPEAELEKRGQIIDVAVDGKKFTGFLLPYRAFGYHRLHVGNYKYRENHLVEHQFFGSWRSGQFSEGKRKNDLGIGR